MNYLVSQHEITQDHELLMLDVIENFIELKNSDCTGLWGQPKILERSGNQ